MISLYSLDPPISKSLSYSWITEVQEGAYFGKAAVTKYHKSSGLNNKELLFHSSGG